MFKASYPQLRIAGPKCGFVKDGEIEEGTWFLDYPDGDIQDLGKEIRVLILATRMTQLDLALDSTAQRLLMKSTRRISFTCTQPLRKTI